MLSVEPPMADCGAYNCCRELLGDGDGNDDGVLRKFIDIGFRVRSFPKRLPGINCYSPVIRFAQTSHYLAQKITLNPNLPMTSVSSNSDQDP